MPSDPWNVAAIEALAPDEASVKAARKLLKEKRFSAIQRRAGGEGWWAKVRGQTDDYEVSAKPPTAAAFDTCCSCPSYKQPCKHAIALLLYLAEHPDERPDESAEPVPEPTGDFEGLLRAAFASPDDDLARLVFADYVEEQGDGDRAAFIRSQVERGGEARPKAAPRRTRRVLRVGGDPDELREGESAALAPVLAGQPEWVGRNCIARRGFLTLTVPGYDPGVQTDWPESLHRLFRQGWVETLRFADALPPITEALCSMFEQVGTVGLGGVNLAHAELAELVAVIPPSMRVGRLRHVHVPARYQAEWDTLMADPDSVRAASAQNQLPYAAHFDDVPLALFRHRVVRGALRGQPQVTFDTRLNGGVLEAFAASPDAEACERLSLHSVTLAAAGARALAASPHLRHVQELTLYNVAWDAEAADVLLTSPLVAGLRELHLSSVAPFGDRELGVLERLAGTAVRDLTIPAGTWTIRWLERLLRAIGPRLGLCGVDWTGRPALDSLALRLRLPDGPRDLRAGGGCTIRLKALDSGAGHHLTLTGTRDYAWPDGADALDWSGVAALTLDGVSVTPGWFAELARCFPRGLGSLTLRSADLRVRHVAPLLAALEVLMPCVLDLSRNALGVRSIKPLVESAGVEALEELDLTGNDVQASALAAIVASPRLTKLKRLGLSEGHMGTVARAIFMRDKPAGLQVTWG